MSKRAWPSRTTVRRTAPATQIVGDLDGAGADDFVFTTDHGSGNAGGTKLFVRRGENGAPMWSRAFPADELRVTGMKLGARGQRGLRIVFQSLDPRVSTMMALDARGKLLWSRRWRMPEGSWTLVEAVASMDGGRDEDSVVAGRGSVEVVDGRDGRTVARARMSSTSEPTSEPMALIEDVSGDGRPDIVSSSHPVTAFEGDTGRRLWRQAVGAVYYVRSAGDVDGDRRQDLIVSGLCAWLLSGRTGKPLLALVRDSLFPLGDVDGDRRSDVRVVASRQRGDRFCTDRVILSAATHILDSTHTCIGVPIGHYGSVFDAAVGDVDGDGADDVATTTSLHDRSIGPCMPGCSDVVWERREFVSGHTGQRLWTVGTQEANDEAEIDDPVALGVVKAPGVDLVRSVGESTSLQLTAVDGGTGAPLWTSSCSARGRGWSSLGEGAFAVADLSRDAVPDVLCLIESYGEEWSLDIRYVRATALSGWDGRVLWTTDWNIRD